MTRLRSPLTPLGWAALGALALILIGLGMLLAPALEALR